MPGSKELRPFSVVRFIDLHPRRFFLDAWRELDEEKNDTSTKSPLIVVYIFTIVTSSLILQDYWGNEATFLSIVAFLDNMLVTAKNPFLSSFIGLFVSEHSTIKSAIVLSGYYELFVLCYWAFWRVLGFLIIPLIAIAIHPSLRKRSMGWSLKGMRDHLWVYAVLSVPVLIAVIVVSFSEDFQSYYPFYSKAHRSLWEFVVWESFYIAQFFSLEFFFRGFMIQPLRKEMGSSAIFAMMIPYVLIHIGKPMIECFAAIIAGIVLGTLAMKTRSIWSGFLIHVTVALSMDILSILQKTKFI